MILVIVQQARDVQLARAVVGAVGADFEFFLLFASRELQREFGEARCKGGVDAGVCLLNPANFQLVVSFSGRREPRLAGSLLLLAFFREVGVATLEIQHALFQPGINDESPDGLELGYAAQSVLGWGGEHGIGYLKSELRFEARSTWGTGFVLVTADGDSHAYSSKQHYQFAIALLKLAASQPQQLFVWPIHPEDARSEARSARSMVQEYRLSNLVFERSVPAEALVEACSAGISTLTTALVEYQLRQKPVLLYACDSARTSARRLQAQTFANTTELETRFAELRAAPERYQVDTGLGRLDASRLEARLREACGGSALLPGWLPVALRYLPAVQAASNSDASIEAQALSEQLQGVIERIGVLQRSTLAYKAKRFVTRLIKQSRR
jgi:hypothetical protein